MGSVSGGQIDAAAGKLSADAYALMKDVDWSSNIFLKKPGNVNPKDALAAVDKALVMGAAMDSKALQEAAQAHVKAISGMDVYNAFGKITEGGVPNYLYSTVNPQDAMKAYNAFLSFKDVVKASR